jgi:hypothetical protein
MYPYLSSSDINAFQAFESAIASELTLADDMTTPRYNAEHLNYERHKIWHRRTPAIVKLALVPDSHETLLVSVMWKQLAYSNAITVLGKV